jgi:phosphohistidine swiveling domain-containing protein
MHDYAIKYLFDPLERGRVLESIKEYDKKLQSFSVSEGYWSNVMDMRTRLKTFLYIRELAEEFGRHYFIMEQPWLISLEDVVTKACDREGLSHDVVLHNPSSAHNFSELEKGLLTTLIEIGHLKLSVHTHIEPLMRSVYALQARIAEETNILLTYAQVMTAKDIEKYLESGTLPALSDLELRTKGAIFIPGEKGQLSKMCIGREYQEWKDAIEPPFTEEIKGAIACRGKVQGRASLHLGWINITEIPSGNILVTGMTNPQMVPYIKHVAAIVTDEGGLTCHAAIISREMKIPCIVGTRVATQVLHDGDLVEVDADTGIVRILERASV